MGQRQLNKQDQEAQNYQDLVDQYKAKGGQTTVLKAHQAAGHKSYNGMKGDDSDFVRRAEQEQQRKVEESGYHKS